jgi:cyclophilin family peptidyl-prolyl cis-trans isomerase
MRRTPWVAVAAAIALLASPANGQEQQQDDANGGAGVRAVLELGQALFYAGNPLPIRISVGNDGDEAAENPVKGALHKGLTVRVVGGEALKPSGKPGGDEPERPAKLAPGSFYGRVVDLAAMYPALREPGRFEISWSAGDLESNRIDIRLIPRYDPAMSYRGVIETEDGEIAIDLFQQESPVAVKAFVDMARAGFYDGLLFHEVRAGARITGGDPIASGVDRRPILFPQETSKLPAVAGTVVLRPVSAAPPANASTFMILLRPESALTGQVTVLGQVVSGLDTARALAQRPSTGTEKQPFFKPIKDIAIRTVRIEERPQAPAQ